VGDRISKIRRLCAWQPRSIQLASSNPYKDTAMIYRVDATVQGPYGNIRVVATNQIEAKTIGEAEAMADDWAKGQRIFGPSSLRIVRNAVISVSGCLRWRAGRDQVSDRGTLTVPTAVKAIAPSPFRRRQPASI
jgi:hypothetical protein